MIFLTGSINLASQDDLEREAAVYQENGWEYRDPTTHKVAITIAEDDIDALCNYLRNAQRDKRPKEWTDRSGVTHQARTVSIYFKGTEMSGTWVRLRARLDDRGTRQQHTGASGHQPPRRATAAQPVRRQPAQPIARPLPPRLDPPAATPAAAAPYPTQQPRPAWNTSPQTSAEGPDDDDVPF